MSASTPARELRIALLLLVFGIAALPALIYLVGTSVIGSYDGDGGIVGLYGAILSGLAELQIAPWILVLSPFAVVQLLRATMALRKPRGPVNPVTKP